MELEQHLARLQDTVDHGFRRLSSRMDRSEILQTERHSQNSTRLDGLTDRVEATNGLVGKAHDRVSKTEALIATITQEIDKLRAFAHKVPNMIQARILCPVVGPDGQPVKDLKDRPVTMMEARWLVSIIIACLTGGALVTVWLLKLVGKL